MSKESATALATSPTNATVAPAIPPTSPVEGAPPAPAPAELESSKFAALAKNEQRLVQERLAVKKQREELLAKEKELTEKLTPFQEFEVLKSKDPVAALRGLGFSETEVFNWLSEAQAPKPATPEEIARNAAKLELENYKKEQADLQLQADAQRDKEVLGKFKSNITSFLAKNSEKYEACADYGDVATDAAYRLVEQVARDNNGEIISLDEAFQTLEDFYEGEYQRMSKYKKYQKAVEAPVEDVPRETPRRVTAQKTLTNAVTATTPAVTTMNRRETLSQKKERLANMLRSGNVVLTK